MKSLRDAVYVHVSNLAELGDDRLNCVNIAMALSGRTIRDFQVVKVARDGDSVSFLSYPTFFEEAFPGLEQSCRVDLLSGRVTVRRYATGNPPILHRKEQMLSPDHPSYPALRDFTMVVEEAGLFRDQNRIGYRLVWDGMIAASGHRVEGHKLIRNE